MKYCKPPLREGEGVGREGVTVFQRYAGRECVLILYVIMLNVTLYFP